MKLVDKSITLAELREMSENMYNGLVKAVVDIEKELVVLDAEMHADQEEFLLDEGSKQEDLWGFNIYPLESDFRIEFDSMINIRPRQNNNSRNVEDEIIQERIVSLCKKLINI